MKPASPRARTLRAATADSLAIDAATVAAVEALSAAGIPSLLLKGPALGRLLYDPGEERSWVDADLLVAPGDHERGMAALATIGFEPRISDPGERDSVPYAVHLVRAPTSGPERTAESVDLHHGFAGVGSPDELFWSSVASRPDRIELFGRSIAVPSVAARLALVALHAGAHGRSHERSLRDLRRATRRFREPEWAEAAALARRWIALDLFVAGLRLDPAGIELLGRLGVSHQPSRTASMRAAGMPRALKSVDQLRRADGFGARVRLLIRKAFPSPQVLRLWQPLARRGRGGLVLAYGWRPFWLLWQLPPLVVAYLRSAKR